MSLELKISMMSIEDAQFPLFDVLICCNCKKPGSKQQSEDPVNYLMSQWKYKCTVEFVALQWFGMVCGQPRNAPFSWSAPQSSCFAQQCTAEHYSASSNPVSCHFLSAHTNIFHNFKHRAFHTCLKISSHFLIGSK